MLILETVEDFRAARRALKGSLAFVPTMGALHAGHVSLMHFGLEHADHVAVSIFVNPTQFGPNEDLDVYPRDRDGDIQKCRDAGCALLFFPPVEQMYPDGSAQLTHVDVDQLTTGLCGASRAGHFRGVTTVVTKLFNIVQPDVAVFGQKDYQQFAVLKQMARDLNMAVEVISAPTHRQRDGLAMSSRNRNLNPADRDMALSLSKGLKRAWALYQSGERDAAVLESTTREHMAAAGVRVDYVSCVDPLTLQPALESQPMLMAVAGFVGNVRLIDNMRLDAPLPYPLS